MKQNHRPDTTDLVLEPVDIPETITSDSAEAFVEMVGVRNAAAASLYGNEEHAMSPRDLLPGYRANPYSARRAWLIRTGGTPAARFVIDLPTVEDRHVAMVQLEVHPEYRGRGIGGFAANAAERIVRDAGRTEIRSWVAHAEVGGPRIGAPTGVGSVPAEDPAARFLITRGYLLGQVERFSALNLDSGSAEALAVVRDRAQAAAGDDYRFVSWTFPTPDEFIDRYAGMKARMSIDAPQGDLSEEPQEWDAKRIREALERPAAEAGRSVRVGAIEHVPTQTFVAYNELFGPPGGTGATDQEDTLVLTEHRGRRLGALVKAENLLVWCREEPGSSRVTTYNAEENAPMIRVNETLGFAVVLREGAWRKIIA